MRFLLFLAAILFASEIKISSNNFFYDSKNSISKFIGNVKVVKGKDVITSKEMIMYFKDKKPYKFEAIKDVKFRLTFENNVTYDGKADKLIYFIKNGDIILKGSVFIKNLETNESIKANYLKLNRFSKNLEIKGKPVNIILKVDE